MTKYLKTNLILSIFATILIATPSFSEPLIVLSYGSQAEWTAGDGKNSFSIDPNHNATYYVESGDTLSSIQTKFYTGSGLDKLFVRLSIILLNPSAFVKNNPNYLYSDKTIYLPGKKDIENLLIGKKIKTKSEDYPNKSQPSSIYFFGG